MTSPRWLLNAAVLVAPLGVVALSLPVASAQAADIVDTLGEQPQFSTFAKAIESAGLAQAMQGEGPYTVFAPTDQAFDQLPQDAVDSLMQEENRDQLEALLSYHVIEGKEIRAKDALGKQTEVATLAGDSLSVDGTGEVVRLVSLGLTVTQATETQVTQGSDMPASEHQQQVLADPPATEQQQTMPQDTGMPSSPHQEQLLKGQQGEQQQAATGQAQPRSGQQAEAESEVTQGSDMPASEHQQKVLADQPATEQQQTMPQDTDMPSSPHQEQVLKGQQPGEQQGQQDQDMLREATVIEPDIVADNGVIHAIDAVLVPQAVLSKLEGMPSQ